MSVESAIYNLLTGNASVAAIVSTKVYHNVLPQSAQLPAITYQQISGRREHTMDNGAVGLVEARFQINCWSNSYVQVRQLADAVRLVLTGYSGATSQCTIEIIMLEEEVDAPQITPGLDVMSRYGKYLDFMIWFREAV